MAKKTRDAPLPKPALTGSRADASAALQKQIDLGEEIYSRQYQETGDELEHAKQDKRRWQEYNRDLLGSLFSNQKIADEYNETHGFVMAFDSTPAKRLQYFREDVRADQNKLISIRDRLGLYDEPASLPHSTSMAPSGLELVRTVLRAFHRGVLALRSRRAERPPLTMADEYDVQYLLNAILRLHFGDVRPEEWTPSYAGGSSRMDFLIPDESLVVEAKRTRPSLRDTQIGEELLVDISRYRAHPAVKSLVCFIYDPDLHIVNPAGLRTDLEKASTAELTVVVIIVPTP